MSQLLIYLHDDRQVDYQFDSSGQTQRNKNQPLETLPRFDEVDTCVVIVPGEDVATRQLVIPETSYSKLIKIVPYALEDQLIDPPESLHFVFDPVNENGLLSIAIVKKTLMANWLTQLRSAHLFAKIMLPDYLALPYEDDKWQVYLTNNKALLRIRADYGVTCDLSQLNLILQLKLQEELTKPHEIVIDYDEINQNFDRNQLKNITIPIKFSNIYRDPLDMFSSGASKATSIDLMHGDFSEFRPKSQTTKLWKICGGLLISCFALWAIFSAVEYVKLDRQLTNLEKQTNQLYFSVFPSATQVIEPDIRIQQLVNQLENTRSGGAFLSLVGLVGQQINTQGNNITIDQLRFSENQLTLEVTSSNFKNLETFTQQLIAKKVQVQESNARETPQGVTARFTLSRKSK